VRGGDRGGPAGMETARVAALRGHKVVLYEKADRLGGQIQVACCPPGKEGFKTIIEYLEAEIRKLKITIHLSTEASPELILENRPDVVIVATGAVPGQPAIPGLESRKVVSAHDVLAGRAKPGRRVVVMGGGMTGCETAHYLVMRSKEVVIIEQLKWVGRDIGPARRFLLLNSLRKAKVKLVTNAIVQSIEDDRLYYRKTTSEPKEQQVLSRINTFVNALGVQSFDPLSDRLRQMVARVEVIGDANRPGTCLNAIADGARVGRSL